MIKTNIDANKILTEGKVNFDLFEDPALVFVDLANSTLAEATDDLMFGTDMELVDLVMMNENNDFSNLEPIE